MHVLSELLGLCLIWFDYCFDLSHVITMQSLRGRHKEMQTFLVWQKQLPERAREWGWDRNSAFVHTQQAESAPLYVHVGDVS